MKYSFLQNGDTALTVQLEKEISEEVNAYVTALTSSVQDKHIDGIIELVPTFCSLMIIYDCTVIRAGRLKKEISLIIDSLSISGAKSARIWDIPVCYDEEFALDIDSVSEHTGLSKEEIVSIHTSKPYLIYMLGFLPGFAYLGGMDKRLVTPRLDSPRLEIFKGAVGIGGEQTGIYPIASPGGWRLIGKTPVNVYDPGANPPILYNAGEYIKFYSISKEEFTELEKQIASGGYKPVCREVEL